VISDAKRGWGIRGRWPILKNSKDEARQIAPPGQTLTE